MWLCEWTGIKTVGEIPCSYKDKKKFKELSNCKLKAVTGFCRRKRSQEKRSEKSEIDHNIR